ncbi:MAG: hypothetical protein ACOX0I_00435 [Bacilli bacterium]
MSKTNFAQRFTDYEYSSKREIAEILGPSYVESVWRLTCDYREKYRFPLALKRFDNFPFTVVLTPAIMAHANTAERKMFEYSILYENYRNRESISEDKVLQAYKEEIVKADLLALAHNADLEVGERDIDLMLEPTSLHLKESQIYGYYKALQYLTTEATSYTFSRNVLRDTYNKIVHSSDKMLRYREKEAFIEDVADLNPKDIKGAPSNRIIEFMDQLFNFYESDFELSPFIIGSIMYAYILYILPFEKYSSYVACLVLQKILAEKGYGEACFYLSLPQSLVKKSAKLKEAYENSRLSGDLTYIIIFLCNLMRDALNWKITNIQTLELPQPIRDEVKVVEKVVEVPVERTIEVIREVIKEVKVPVEKIVYVERPASSNVTAAGTTNPSLAKEKDPYANVDTLKLGEKIEIEKVEEEQKIREYPRPPEHKATQFDFMEDPFASKLPVYETPKASKEVLKPNVPTETIRQEEPSYTPEEPSESPDTEVKKAEILHDDMREAVAKLIDLPPEQMAKGLIEINPLIRYHQASFYAHHHDFGRYYTISQFKKFANCAYETARTSMECLVSLCLYRKEQLKNKFVYTPTAIKEQDK